MKTLRRELGRLAAILLVLYVLWCLAVGHNVTMAMVFYGTDHPFFKGGEKGAAP